MSEVSRPVLLRLNAAYVAARLGRPLRGSVDHLRRTGEHALLDLVNTASPEDARRAIAGATPGTDVGLDFLAFLADYIETLEAYGAADKRYPIDIPMKVWHEYARRAREEHRPIRVLLTEALVAHAERIRQAKEGEAGATRLLQVAQRELREQLARLGQFAERAEGNAVDVTRLTGQISHHGAALTAILMSLDDQRKLSPRAIELLKKKGWM